MSRQTRRTTRQTASLDEEIGLSQRSSLLSAQARHPIARRGTRRTQQQPRRSPSVDHVKSSADIGYDEADDNDSVVDTIALASQSQNPPVDQDMLDDYHALFPMLVQACDEVYKIHQDIGSEEPTNRQRKRLGHQDDVHKSLLRKLGEDEYLDTFAPPWDNSMEVTQNAQVSPQETAFRSNTASLLKDIFDHLYIESPYEGNFFEHLDNVFPAHFAQEVDQSRALDLAFRIRCHHFAAKLQAGEKPILLATRIFCGEEYTALAAARQRLSRGPYKALLGLQPSDSESLNETYQTSMQTLLEQVLNGRTTQAVQSSLEGLCPRKPLLEELRSWALATYHTHALAKGSVDSTLHPEKEAQNVENMDDDELEDDSSSDVDMPPVVYPELDGPSNGSYFDGTATIEKPAPSNATSMNAAAASPLRKQIRLQEGVRNLNVEDLLGSQAVASSPAREPSVVPGSPSVASDAAREDAAILDTVDDDPFQEEEDDDDFEQRTAPVNQSRRLATMQSTQPANRVLPKPRSPPAPSGTARTYVNPTQASTTSSVPPTASQMEDLRTLARLNRRAVAAKSEQRRRIPWSVRDEEILVELIRKYECSWSMIAEEGGFETSRDQQACRDKARNLKVVYLSTDQPLPALFDKVALSKKERDAVRNAGRNPSRCEADIDDDGQVINTIDPDL